MPAFSDELPAPAASASHRPVLLLLAALATLSVVLAYTTSTTYDAGDSIIHYLFSRYAFRHPTNFLDSWAKPAFVLLTAGPAQLGFRGIELFQCAVVAAAAWLAYRVAAALRLPWPWLALVFTYAAPDYFRIQFSGLTEPLFSLVLVAAVALAVRDRAGWSAAVVSALPFVRSEGFLLLGVWAVYLVWSGLARHLPKLLLGYVAFSLVGMAYYHDFLWVFTHNAYPYRASQYGHGPLSHYLTKLPGVLGLVLFGLFWVGGLRMVVRWLRPRLPRPVTFRAELLLVYGSVVVYCGAHALFWWQGIFASFGMVRVLNAVVPLMAVISLSGLQGLAQLAARPAGQRRVRAVGAAAVVLFLFTGARTALRWQRDFVATADQELSQDAAQWLRRAYPGRWPLVVVEHPYLTYAFGVDPFDPGQRQQLGRLSIATPQDTLPAGTLVCWDDWFAVTEAGVPLSRLQQDVRYRLRWRGARVRDPKHPTTDSTRVLVFERR